MQIIKIHLIFITAQMHPYINNIIIFNETVKASLFCFVK
jgi:hypothetical protein